ncbi:MAG: hypothetical protein WC586_02065 [Methanoregula sp.]
MSYYSLRGTLWFGESIIETTKFNDKRIELSGSVEIIFSFYSILPVPSVTPSLPQWGEATQGEIPLTPIIFLFSFFIQQSE